ncbi:hypothetical protein H9P43_008762 [Blastocladiella emersonii ATCC 22665]|nr:hypothetical protein H9P43_008762 [Blastocladiella emersonii ATCC 22665]
MSASHESQNKRKALEQQKAVLLELQRELDQRMQPRSPQQPAQRSQTVPQPLRVQAPSQKSRAEAPSQQSRFEAPSQKPRVHAPAQKQQHQQPRHAPQSFGDGLMATIGAAASVGIAVYGTVSAALAASKDGKFTAAEMLDIGANAARVPGLLGPAGGLATQLTGRMVRDERAEAAASEVSKTMCPRECISSSGSAYVEEAGSAAAAEDGGLLEEAGSLASWCRISLAEV